MRRVKVDPDLVHVAYHEAGHAVIGIALGSHPHFITIVPSEGSMGRVVERNYPPSVRDVLKFGNPWDVPPVLRRVLNDATVLFAGAIAERRRTRRRYKWDTESSDRERVHEILLGPVVPEGQEREYGALDRFLRLRSRRLVGDCWPAIDAVAKELLVKGSLSGREIWEIVIGIQPQVPPEPWFTAEERQKLERQAASQLLSPGAAKVRKALSSMSPSDRRIYRSAQRKIRLGRYVLRPSDEESEPTSEP